MRYTTLAARGNATESRRLYGENLPDSTQPCVQTFTELRETGSFKMSMNDTRRVRAKREWSNPRTSTRATASAMDTGETNA